MKKFGFACLASLTGFCLGQMASWVVGLVIDSNIIGLIVSLYVMSVTYSKFMDAFES